MATALDIRWDVLPYLCGNGLDIGCGDARPHEWLTGVDIRPGTTQRGPNLVMDARKVKGYFAPESQDYIFSSHLLNELEDWPALLADWWSLIKQDGYLIIFLPLTENCQPTMLVDAMRPLKPWQFVEAKLGNDSFWQVYRKCDKPSITDPIAEEKICAVVKLGAHGDALWASSVFPGLKEQGYYVLLYTQETGEQVLRHDPHIDRIIRFESRVPLGELGEFFAWMDNRYKNTRILVECVEGSLLPSPAKIQYHFPVPARHKLMNMNYAEMHHLVAGVPYIPRQKFYPSDEEKRFVNEFRGRLQPYLVVFVPNGSSLTKMWPYATDFAKCVLEREDVSLVVMGDGRGFEAFDHPRLVNIGTSWDIRQCMTLCQLANVVVGQETGLLNCVAMEAHVHKIVLMTHSSVNNLTRDWLNTTSIRKMPACAPCHRLHYSFEYCMRDEKTQAALCQTMIPVQEVLEDLWAAIPVMEAVA